MAAAARQALRFGARTSKSRPRQVAWRLRDRPVYCGKKLQQAEASLYGGTVRNPKELQDLQAEVASLKKHLITLDADEIAWMEKLEAADASSGNASADLEKVLLGFEFEHGQLRQRELELLHDEGEPAQRARRQQRMRSSSPGRRLTIG